MYLRLELKNCFVHKHLVVDFQTGLTHISGLNGRGKSLILEMSEFCLWGSKALRGKSEDYKGMSAALNFEIRGVKYGVERTITSARLLSSSGEVLASGTKPVNARIAELFGYSYEVFKTTNVARQGEIERMGSMLPTERKKLVDETIGLSRIDDLANWVKDQYKDLPGQIKGLQAAMQEPPPEPAPPAEERPDMGDLQTKLGVYNANVSYLSEPVAPTPHPLSDSYAVLQAQQQARVRALGEKAGLYRAIKNHPALPSVSPVLHPQDAKRGELYDTSEKYRQAVGNRLQIDKALQGVPLDSTVAESELLKAEEAIRVRALIAERNRLREKQATYQCPNCSHEWHDEDPRLKDYAHLPEEMPDQIYNAKQISEFRKVNSYQATRQTLLQGLTEIDAVISSTQDWSVTVSQIDKARQDVSRYQELLRGEETRQQLIQQHDEIVVPDDVSATIHEIDGYLIEQQKYFTALEKHRTAKKLLEQLPPNMPQVYQDAYELDAQWTQYGYRKHTWEQAVAAYETYTEQLTNLQTELQNWRAAAEAITLLRQRIKGYLLPSLNSVASQLVALMSNGWLPWLVVNDDFDIIVGGQPIYTLTGGGKAITNLALRIALGQVLTNSVFSSLVIDEGDAGVDEEKAPLITESLKKLTGTIKQVIVISHKHGLVADHRIEL